MASYDNNESSRQEIADRYRVSLGMVKKLVQQRKRSLFVEAPQRRQDLISPGNYTWSQQIIVGEEGIAASTH